MPDEKNSNERPEKPVQVTFNAKIQKRVARLNVPYDFHEYCHMAVREQIIRDEKRMNISPSEDES